MSAFIIRAYQILAYVGFVGILVFMTATGWYVGEQMGEPGFGLALGLGFGLIFAISFAGIAITLIDTRNQLVALNARQERS